ncbi:hypothetical protein [Tissierella praeacuta]|uniref:hypothetical protein n=1 Tax=Tissierella praeacuta TaxID=43131 RepID=UPI002FD96FF9
MEKISYNRLKEIKKELLFYDFDNLNAKGNQIIVKFKDDFSITRFDDIRFGGLSEDFETQACIIEDLIIEIIKYYGCENIILAKYESNWIMNKDKSLELTTLFKSNGLRTNFS